MADSIRRTMPIWIVVFVLALVGLGGLVLDLPPDRAAAANVEFEQCNGVGNTGGRRWSVTW